MAIALDQNLGGANTASSGTTQTLSTAQTAASGSKIIVCTVFGGASAGTVTISGGGLTWNVDKLYQAPDTTQVAIHSADAPSGLASATSLTATSTTAGNPRGMVAASFTGLALTGSVLDGTPSTREQLNSTSWTANSITTTNANDLIFCVTQTGGVAGTPTNTPGGSMIALNLLDVSGNNIMATQYQIVSATGTYTPTGTWSVSQTGADQHHVVVAYQAASGVTPTPPKLVTYAPEPTGFPQIAFSSRWYAGFGSPPANWLNTPSIDSTFPFFFLD